MVESLWIHYFLFFLGSLRASFRLMALKKLLMTVCAVAALSGVAADDAAARETLRVGTEPTFAPFEFMDTESREFVGYDIDLIRAIADKAGYDIKVVNMGFDALIPALSTGVVDVVAAGLTITEERAKRVDFTEPYYTAGLSILVRKQDAEKYKDFNSLANQTIAVQIGTTGADKAKDIPGAKVTNFNATSEAFMALSMGSAEAVVHDRPVLAYFMKTQPRVAQTLQLQPVIEDAQQYGFAVRKNNKDLLDKLQKGFEAVRQSGEDKKIYDKWFAQ